MLSLSTFGLQPPEASSTYVAQGVVAAAVLTCPFKRSGARPSLDEVPIPGNHSFLWGHQRTVADKSVGTAFATWMEELHVQVFRLRGALFQSDILVLGDPLAATHIMQKKVYTCPRLLISPQRGVTLNWLSQLAGNLKVHISERDGKCDISIVDWVNQATLEASGRLGFGHDFEGGRSDDARKILGAWKSMASLGISTAGFYVLMMLRRSQLLNYLPLKALCAQGNVRNTIHQWISKETRTVQNPLILPVAPAHGSGPISTEELMDHINVFIVAGSETTAQCLTYAVWELARHPDIQSRLREEVVACSCFPSYDDPQIQLPYLDAVMREVPRMHPAAPSMEHVAVKDDVLPLRHPIAGTNGKDITSIAISAGQNVIIPIHTMNCMDSVWHDGDNFRPERWLEKLPKKDLCTTDWSRMLAFSDGPRNCIEYRFAILQFKIILFTLVQRFKFDDTRARIISKVASSMQPVVVGEEYKGPRLPVSVSFL